VPYDPAVLGEEQGREDRELLRAMAIAGFAAMNVMLLSVSIWAGHAQGMGPATRDVLHWLSALIALPAVIFAGRPFFRSAWSALKARRVNMDVPISLAVLLASLMSLHETAVGNQHAYFDSAITLLFFLLVGRYLDRRARTRARSAAAQLLGLSASTVTVIDDDGSRRLVAPGEIRAGMTVLVAAGERIGIDGDVRSGESDVDCSLITGESLPLTVAPGTRVFAGTLNLGQPLVVTVTAVGEGTFLAEIVRLMETAEQGRASHVALADRVARAYAPVVHTLALSTFAGWWLVVGVSWQQSLTYAIAVLIITCPCALALAVPVVQVLATSRLLKRGILLKSPTALERLATVNRTAFDKTGTLTLGRPALVTSPEPEVLRRAARLAMASHHPLAKALVAAAPRSVTLADGVREVPGKGLELGTERLGSRTFLGLGEADAAAEPTGPELWYREETGTVHRFGFSDRPREDAGAVIAALNAQGLAPVLLSGDRESVVRSTAEALHLADWRAELTPDGKCQALAGLAGQGQRVMMVGDGLNDAPALAAAHVSLSPSSAVDVSQTAADVVFQGQKLAPVLEVLYVARRADTLVRQNFALAFLYNVITIPLAVTGHVTPLIAAVAMSSSSVVVIANALRLGGGGPKPLVDR
ncbi:MAG: copper-translocating P-type ATPase, partial [Rhodospirillales bacterium]